MSRRHRVPVLAFVCMAVVCTVVLAYSIRGNASQAPETAAPALGVATVPGPGLVFERVTSPAPAETEMGAEAAFESGPVADTMAAEPTEVTPAPPTFTRRPASRSHDVRSVRGAGSKGAHRGKPTSRASERGHGLGRATAAHRGKGHSARAGSPQRSRGHTRFRGRGEARGHAKVRGHGKARGQGKARGHKKGCARGKRGRGRR